MFGNNVINQFTAGYNRVFNYITSFGYGSNKSRELGIPGANLGTDETSSLTRMTFQNFVGIGDRGFSPFQGGTNVFHYTDTLTMVKGSHALNIGGTVRAMQLNLLGDTALAGQFAFTPFFTAGFNAGRRAERRHRQLRSPACCSASPHPAAATTSSNGSVKGRRWKEFRGVHRRQLAREQRPHADAGAGLHGHHAAERSTTTASATSTSTPARPSSAARSA